MAGQQPDTRKLTVKSALHYHETEMPCNWDVNVYRGCGHGCKYCFAQYSHDYLDSADFFSEIFVKGNVAEVLDHELRKKSWKKKRINLSGVTDAYQPAEAVEKIMPGVLEVLIRHRNPVAITTKSSLLLRDISLFRQLASVTSVCVGASITTLDAGLQKLLEPNASSPGERFRVLKECAEAGCWTNVMATPVLPFITDSVENLESLYREALKNNAKGLSAWPLNLRGNTKPRFFRFLQQHFPHLLDKYRMLYPGWTLDKAYATELREKSLQLRKKYQLPGVNIPPEPLSAAAIQLELF